MIPPEVRYDPETGRVAIKMELEAPRTWFIMGTTSGGHYAPGTRSPDAVAGWPPYVAPEIAEDNSED